MENSNIPEEESNQSPAPSNNMNTVINQEALPNSTAILALGIASIVTCCCYGFLGLICGVICLVMFKKANELYNLNPDKYTESSLKNLKAGKIMGIVGLSLSGLCFIYYIVYIILYGAFAVSQLF